MTTERKGNVKLLLDEAQPEHPSFCSSHARSKAVTGKQRRRARRTVFGHMKRPATPVFFNPTVMKGFLMNPQQWLRRERDLLQSDQSARKGAARENPGQVEGCGDLGPE